jgi:hypothetical protein
VSCIHGKEECYKVTVSVIGHLHKFKSVGIKGNIWIDFYCLSKETVSHVLYLNKYPFSYFPNLTKRDFVIYQAIHMSTCKSYTYIQTVYVILIPFFNIKAIFFFCLLLLKHLLFPFLTFFAIDNFFGCK